MSMVRSRNVSTTVPRLGYRLIVNSFVAPATMKRAAAGTGTAATATGPTTPSAWTAIGRSTMRGRMTLRRPDTIVRVAVKRIQGIVQRQRRPRSAATRIRAVRRRRRRVGRVQGRQRRPAVRVVGRHLGTIRETNAKVQIMIEFF